jgi:hypothetical protein
LGPKHGFMGQMGPSFLQNYPFAWGNMFMWELGPKIWFLEAT